MKTVVTNAHGSIHTTTKGLIIMAGALLWFCAELIFVSLGWSDTESGPKSAVIKVGSGLALLLPQMSYLYGLPALNDAGIVRRKLPVRLAQVAIAIYSVPFLVAALTKSGLSEVETKPVVFLLPLGLLLIAASMTYLGIVIWKTGVWSDWRRLTPFGAGLFPVVLMLPLAAIYGKPNYILVGVWGLTWFLLGLALYRTRTYHLRL